MPGPIAYAAIALQARDRLRQIRDALKAKIDSGGPVNPLDRQVHFLAKRAVEMMSAAQPVVTPPPMRLYGPALQQQISKFVTMGAIGPDIPGYAALFAEGQSWLRDTLHKGTPDANREQVLAGSCSVVLSFWNKVQPLLNQEFSNQDDAAAKKKLMQAYVLGHFCHIAADLVATPYIDNLEFRLGRTAAPARPKLSREQIIGAIDVAASRVLFHRGTATRGNHWVDWWPTGGQVPGSFYKAWKAALEETYGAGAVRKGLAGYEKFRADAKPPALSEDLLKDGYATFRNVVDTGKAWDLVDWLGATWFLYAPSFLALLIATQLPNGKDLFRDTKPPGYDDDKAKFELIALPFAVNALVPVYYSLIATTSYLGAESEVVLGWVSAGIQVAAAAGYFFSLTASKDTLPWRWVLLLVVPLALEAAHAIYTIWKGASNPRRLQLLFTTILSPFLSLLFLLFYYAFLHKGVETGSDTGAFVGVLIAWFLILGLVWFVVAAILRWTTLGVAGEQASELVTTNRHHIRLFDDTTLYLLQPRGASPALADLFYPSGRRELLKIWWTGGGTAPTLNSKRNALEFKVGAAPVRTILAPAAPTKLADFAAYLERAVAGLKTKLFFPDAADEDYELPPGLVFSDEGDGSSLEETYKALTDAAAAPIGTSEEHAYVLFHAPKEQQSVRFDRTGPTVDQEERTTAQRGNGTVSIAANSKQVTLDVTPAATRFPSLFRAGDIIEAAIGTPNAAHRVVVSVDSDRSLTVSTPFPAALAGVTFGRAARTFRQDPPGLVEDPPGGWQVQSVQNHPNLLDAAGGAVFGELLRPGDTIHVRPGGANPPQERTVIDVISDSQISISRPLDSPLTFHDYWQTPPARPAVVPAPFVRVVKESEQLYGFVNGSDDVFGDGVTLMNEAADLATLLCLGATSHLLSDGERTGTRDNPVQNIDRVYQVFRNWDLDRRRENEWKMLIFGGAVSEKRGDLAGADVALPAGGRPIIATAGEPISNQLGWVNVLRQWFDMAHRPETNTKADVPFRPDAPTNLALSRALAYLLDLHDPAA